MKPRAQSCLLHPQIIEELFRGCGQCCSNIASVNSRNPALLFGQRMPRHRPFLHPKFPANTDSAWRAQGCKSMRQRIHRFPPHSSLRTRYETEKARSVCDYIQRHSMVDLVEEETYRIRFIETFNCHGFHSVQLASYSQKST